MTDGETPDERPKATKRTRAAGKRKAKNRKLPNRNGERPEPRARARDPDRSASGLPSLRDITREVRIETLLDRLAEEGEEITVAARAVGLDRSTLWRWRKEIPDLDARLEEAYRVGTESLVAVAKNRAIHGWEEPVFQQGRQVGTIRKYDHALLQFIIRKRDPSFRDPKYSLPVMAPRLPGEISLDLDRMPPDLLAKLEAEARRQAEELAAAR